MRVTIKWLEGARKRPVPSQYACTLSFENPPVQLYSAILTFPQQVRTYAELELLVVKDLDIPDGIFYITEGNHVVAEAWVLQEPEPTLVRNTKKNGVLGWQIVENGEWVNVDKCPPTLSLFHKTTVEYDTKLLRGESCT